MTVAVITVARGRHDHLRLQRAGLARSERRPDHTVLVAMDDRGLAADDDATACTVHLDVTDGHLPLARARNVGARTAMERGADVLVFLDVDCIPSPSLVGAYERAARSGPTAGDLLSGPVTYLPPAPAGGYRLDTMASLAEPHAARPVPDRDAVLRTTDRHELFWSLSFALTRQTWDLIGGFDESYVGYGAEDTDFGRRAAAVGAALTWLGDAGAFHQHHPVSSPPVEHVDDIVRNAAIFHERWGSWPMLGWLEAFREQGLVRLTDAGWVVAEGAERARLG